MTSLTSRWRQWLGWPGSESSTRRDPLADYQHVSVQQCLERLPPLECARRLQHVHQPHVFTNPLPCNIADREQLPQDRGWWGFSFHDVPQRLAGETFIATIPDATVVWYRDEAQEGDFYPAIVSGSDQALTLREVRLRPGHLPMLRSQQPPLRITAACWFLERVYHNHSHWLTAHLPKLLLLKERHLLGQTLLPPARSAVIEASLRRIGIDPAMMPSFDFSRPLHVDELTLIGSDRFRPELVRRVPEALGIGAKSAVGDRLFISRAGASRRRLLNEDALWPMLHRHGFERIRMEDLTFDEQVDRLRRCGVLCGPHGAGLTNMMFCPRGAHVIEIADPSFPNPNFYGLASALGHRYWLTPARSEGTQHPLWKDLLADEGALSQVLDRLPDDA